MKTNAHVAASFALAALIASSAVTTADELLVNGGFEQGTTSWTANPAFPAFSPIADGHISAMPPDFSKNWIARQNLNVGSPADVELTLSADLLAA